MPRPTDLPAGEGSRVLVLACGALAREVLAIRDASGLAHVDLQCLPAILHNRPERIAAAVEAAVEEARGRYGRIFVAYADCGTGGELARTCERLGVAMIAGPHCYSFFEGNAAFEARGEVTHLAHGVRYYMLDFLQTGLAYGGVGPDAPRFSGADGSRSRVEAFYRAMQTIRVVCSTRYGTWRATCLSR